MFAFWNRVIDLRATGKRQILHLEGKSDSAGRCKSWKIGSQSVAYIHHGMDGEISCEPPRFRNSWNELQMLLFHGSAESTSDKKIIANIAAPTRYTTVSFDKANNANRNRHGTGYATRFAADDADFESLRGPAQSAIKLLHPLNLRLLRSNERDQGKLRDGRCCREIADRTHHRFPADVARFRRCQEMYTNDNEIGFEHKKVYAIAGFHHSAIIPGTVDNDFCERKIRQKPAEQLIFSDLAQFH